MSNLKFKVGDKVRVIAIDNGDEPIAAYEHLIGSTGYITHVASYNMYPYSLSLKAKGVAWKDSELMLCPPTPIGGKLL